MSRSIAIRVGPALDQVDLRADPADAVTTHRVAVALGSSLPPSPNSAASSPDGDRHVLWLGPDQWLVVGPGNSASTIEAAIRDAAAGAFVTTVDVSAARVVLEVTGTRARDLLSFGCALDLDPRTFGPGSCAQTLVARAGVILWLVADDPVPTYRLLVRPSFAAYLQTWLNDAAVGLG